MVLKIKISQNKNLTEELHEPIIRRFEKRTLIFYRQYFGCWSTIIFIIFLESLMFYQIFLSPQVKRCEIITHKHGIYELPHEVPNDLRLT